MDKLMEYLTEFPSEFWNVTGQMAPSLLFGFLLAGVLSAFIPEEKVAQHLGSQGFWSIFKAALFGVPLPLCSCGVIPVAASLRKNGASRGALAAFLISTPQTGVDSIVVTYTMLGPIFAIFRPIAALIAGIIGGAATQLFGTDPANGQSSDTPKTEPAPCCGAQPATTTLSAKIHHVFSYGFGTLMADVALSLLLGIGIATVIAIVVPDNWVTTIVGTGIGAMFLMLLFGVPLYVCATASVPIAAAMMMKGVPPGAAFVFLMTGPVTNAVSLTTINKIMGLRSTILYLASVIISAFIAGFALNYFAGLYDVSTTMGEHEHGDGTSLLHHVSALVLLSLVVVHLYKQWFSTHTHTCEHGDYGAHADHAKETACQDHDHELTIEVQGMSCSHCEQCLENALLELDGIEKVEADSSRNLVWIKLTCCFDGNVAAIHDSIRNLGYDVTTTDADKQPPKTSV